MLCILLVIYDLSMHSCILINNILPGAVKVSSLTSNKDINFWTFEPLDEHSPTVIAFNDRCANYGDGVFTTMLGKIVQGSIVKGSIVKSNTAGKSIQLTALKQHITRLCNDASKIFIPINERDLHTCIEASARHILEDPELARVECDIVVKVLLSRGVGGRAYEPPKNPSPTIYISIFKFQNNNQHTIATYKVGISRVVLAPQSLLAGIKHLNRLEQILAKQEIMDKGWDDALLCSSQGKLIEGSASNLFVYKDGIWFSPPIDDCGVKGVMRNRVIEFFKDAQMAFIEVELAIENITSYTNVFLCNAVKGIIPVSHVIINESEHAFANGQVLEVMPRFSLFLQKHVVSIGARE